MSVMCQGSTMPSSSPWALSGGQRRCKSRGHTGACPGRALSHATGTMPALGERSVDFTQITSPKSSPGQFMAFMVGKKSLKGRALFSSR